MANIEVGREGIAVTTRTLRLEQLACWLMTGLLGGGGAYGYMQRGSIPSLVAGIGFGAAYGYSGYLIRNGRGIDGVDMSILASAILLLAMGPRAYRTRNPVPVAISSAGALVITRMGYVSYCLRHAQ